MGIGLLTTASLDFLRIKGTLSARRAGMARGPELGGAKPRPSVRSLVSAAAKLAAAFDQRSPLPRDGTNV